MTMATSVPYSFNAKPVATSTCVVTPSIPNAVLNRSVKVCTTADIALEPILNTINPMTVFIVPLITSVADFFCSNRPIKAMSPIINAVLRDCARIISNIFKSSSFFYFPFRYSPVFIPLISEMLRSFLSFPLYRQCCEYPKRKEPDFSIHRLSLPS